MSINNLLKPAGTTTLRSYQHASRIFVDGNYRLSPKYGFLFYVEFDFNPMITNVSNTSAQEMGMIVKSVNLPKFTIDTKVHNAYNRKNIVQNAIKYDPINITFHDDQADNVRNFWYDYYSFFYRDSDYADSTYQIINKYQERPSFDWGYSPRDNGSYNSSNAYQDYQYIQAIRIYSLYQKNFSEYELVNPIITSFRHGEHANGENTSILEHQMSVQFETVKYQTGYTTQNTAGGYIDLHYDNTPSPIAPTAGTNLVDNGQGGYTTASDTVTDLAFHNITTNGGTVVPPPNGAAVNAALSFASAIGSGTSLAAGASPNSGGFSLPSLGSLTAGISNSNIIGQQLQAATLNLAGTAASTLAGGLIKGLTTGLGPQGTQLAGLAVAAIANPSAALATVENMALKFAMGTATSIINSYVQQAGTSVTNSVSKFLAPYGQDITQGLSYVSANAKLITDPNGLVTPVTDPVTGQITYTFTPSSVVNATTTAINTDASSLASQGLSYTQISQSLQTTYGTDPAVADLLALNAVNLSGASSGGTQPLQISVANGDNNVVVGDPISINPIQVTIIPPDASSAPPIQITGSDNNTYT